MGDHSAPFYDHSAPTAPWCGLPCPDCTAELPWADLDDPEGNYFLLQAIDECGRPGSLGEATPGPRDAPLAGECP